MVFLALSTSAARFPASERLDTVQFLGPRGLVTALSQLIREAWSISSSELVREAWVSGVCPRLGKFLQDSSNSTALLLGVSFTFCQS